MFKNVPGPVLMIGSSVCFATGGMLVKSVPWPAFAINGMRCIIAALVIMAYMKLSGTRFRVNRTVAIGAVCLCATTFLYAVANKLTTAGNVIVLQFTSPIFVMLWSRLFFKKRPKRLDILACVFVFAGVIVFFIDSLSAGNMLGNALAIMSGATFAGVYLMNEGKGAHPLSSVLLADFMSFIISVPWLFKTDFPATGAKGWISILILGLVQVGVAYVFFTEGIKKTRPVTASLLSVVEVVLNPVLAAVFMNETLSPLSYIGAFIIVVSVTAYNVILARLGSGTAEEERKSQ